MKQLRFLLTLTLIPFLLFGQTQEPCHFGHVTEQKMQQNPSYAQEVQQFQQNITQRLQQYQAQGNGARAVRTVSVVVHVVYNTAAENVSQTFVNNMINTLNEDYRKQNSDLGSTRNSYVSIAGDAEIEFCLDQTIRVNTSKTCFDPDTETDDMKFASSGGSNAVNPSQFLNIWIVDLCGNSGGGVAGYAYLPTQGVVGSNVDGLIVDYDLGFNQGFGRTATHEIGHYFGLQHPWGSDANPSCNVDDGFNDTPNTDGPNYFCSPSNSCNTPAPGDMYENFMDYAGGCSNMFTQDQVDYMNLVLTQVRSGLLNSSGCSSTPTAPTADFSADKQSVCPGETVNFTDASSGTVSSWAWTFPGGSPGSSTQQNPSVSYSSPGTYGVTLTVSGSNGNDTETKTGFITVVSSQNLPLVEGFQNTPFPPSNWELLNFDNNTTWERTTTAGAYGQSSASMYIDNYNYNAAGNQDVLLTPNYDFSNVSNAYLKYDYAYAFYGDPQYSDTLIIGFTNDCGANYYLLKSFGGASLSTAGVNTNAFTPAANDWSTDSLSLGFLAGSANIQFAFINLNGYGNNLYIDNINIDEVVTNAPPLADFQASATTVNVGGTVNFTDLSTNAPTSWSWTFQGGTPSSSSQQNPSITYNTLGTYNVSLTASNSFGSDTETKTAYINVVNNTVPTCDTLSNFSATDTITVYRSDNVGYVSGHNGYGDIAKADFFQANAGELLSEVSFLFGIGRQVSGTATVDAKIWDADGVAGAPNTVLATQNIPLSTIVNAVNNGNFITVQFPTAVTLNGNFYAGIEFTYANGDTVALVTNLNGNTVPGTAWEKWDTGDWYNYSDSWALNMSHIIIPVVCQASIGNPPVADFSSNLQSACEGATVNFTDLSTNNPSSWAWTFQGGTPSISSDQNPTVTYNSNGTYQVSLTVTNSDGSDTKTESGYINITASPNLSGNSNNLSCNGANDGSITLNVNGGTSPYTYAWSNGRTTKDISNLNDGNYSVTVTDNNGCVSNTSFTVTEPAALQISGSITDADCGQNNGVISATVNGGSSPYSYFWSNNGNTSSISSLGAGNYTVTVTDNNNCSNTRTFSVSNTGAPAISILKTNVTCGGDSDGAVRAEVSGGNPPYSFQWSNGGADSLLTNLGAGNYDVTVTDNNNCIATGNATITEPDTLKGIITGNNPSCGLNNGSLTLNAQGGTPPYTNSWSNGSNGLTLNNLGAGNYSSTLTDGNGCQTISSYSLSAFNAPTLILNATDINCSGTGGNISSTVSGGTPPYTYSWSNGQSSSNLNNLNAGTYILTVTDDAGCSVVKLATINTSGPSVTINKTNVLACYGDNTGSISLLVTGGSLPYSYNWGNGQSAANLNGLTAGTYTVTITDGSNCQVVNSIFVSQPDSFAIDSQYQDADAGQNNGSASVSVSGATPPYSYSWSNGNTSSSVNNLAPGNYTLTVRDANACSEVVRFEIEVTNSIDELENTNNWILYPNPAIDILFIKTSSMPNQNVEINVYSALGADMNSNINRIHGEYSIDLDTYSQGVYFVELKYNNKRIMKRFVVTK